jgi:hypothetical protein
MTEQAGSLKIIESRKEQEEEKINSDYTKG